MECTVCGNSLKEIDVGNIKVDVCEDGCGGIWFDRFELEKVDEPHESEGELLLHIRRGEGVEVDMEKRRNCPRCRDTIMMRHFFSVRKEVEVDECPKCAGTWLDFGELGRIREEFRSEDERKEAAGKYFSKILVQELAGGRDLGDKELNKGKTLERLIKLMGPGDV